MMHFWLLTAATALSKVGNQFLVLAMPWAIIESTGSTGLGIISLGVQYIPYLIAPILGGIIDKYDRRRLFIAAELVQALCVASVPFFLYQINVWALLSVLLISGVGSVLSSLTSSFVLLPALVPPERIDWAYSRHNTMIKAAHLAGPALAGLTIATLGTSTALYLDSVTFLGTAFIVWLLPVSIGAIRSSNKKQNLYQLVNDGIAAYTRRPDLKLLTISLSIYNLGAGSILALLIAVSNSTWNLDVQTVGAAISIASVFAIIGALSSSHILSRYSVQHRLAVWLGIAAAGGIALLINHPLAALLAFCLYSLGDGGANVMNMTFRQKSIPVELSGRLNAIIRMFMSGAVAVSSFLVGGLSTFENYTLQFIPIMLATVTAFIVWRSWVSSTLDTLIIDSDVPKT